MRNGKSSCLFGEELVSYIYGELPAVERHSFEAHLLNCFSCTAEFAELSISRLGVYEWQRDEFAPLETPRFAIPYAKPEPGYSWLDAIRGFVFTPTRLSFAGSALAIMAMALGFVYLKDSNSGTVAEIQIQAPVVEIARPDSPTLAKVVDEVQTDKYIADKALSEGVAAVQDSSKSEQKPAIVRVVTQKKPASRQLTARRNRPANAPRLGTFEEVEDTSLRLADLVADIDSYRK